MSKDKQLILIARHFSSLEREFLDLTYGKCMFFPDDVQVRHVKFMQWLAERYGFADQLCNDLEKCELIDTLKQR